MVNSLAGYEELAGGFESIKNDWDDWDDRENWDDWDEQEDRAIWEDRDNWDDQDDWDERDDQENWDDRLDWDDWNDFWVARDVTKNQTKKVSILLSFYFHEVLQYLNTFT